VSFDPDADDITIKLRTFLNDAVDEAAYILRAGTPEAKLTLLSKVVPAMARVLDAEADSLSVRQMREEQTAMMEAVRAALMPVPVLVEVIDAEVIPEDQPPPVSIPLASGIPPKAKRAPARKSPDQVARSRRGAE